MLAGQQSSTADRHRAGPRDEINLFGLARSFMIRMVISDVFAPASSWQAQLLMDALGYTLKVVISSASSVKVESPELS